MPCLPLSDNRTKFRARKRAQTFGVSVLFIIEQIEFERSFDISVVAGAQGLRSCNVPYIALISSIKALKIPLFDICYGLTRNVS